MQMLLEPLIEAIAMLEQDTCCISMVYWKFSQLQREPRYNEPLSNVPRGVQTSIRESITSKWAFLHTDAMGVSFLLEYGLGIRGRRPDPEREVCQGDC
jgi:hypothetical protein